MLSKIKRNHPPSFLSVSQALNVIGLHDVIMEHLMEHLNENECHHSIRGGKERIIPGIKKLVVVKSHKHKTPLAAPFFSTSRRCRSNYG
jgi:hypothetical protein